jgi:MinD-like ATPase involved in chromosome partitioning or flagellar assembly
MALANVAFSLARKGRRVLIIDFDLEAPGLDAFPEFSVDEKRPGIVEYVSEYLSTGVAPSVKDFAHPVSLAAHLSGSMWMISAGRADYAYNRSRAAIDWQDLYNTHNGQKLIENFKADIEDSFRPDFVFVDSRTGLTDIGGVCTLHLPELVVLMFSLNEQNLLGTASVARVLRDSEKAPQLLLVASPVPNLPRDSASALNERFDRAKQLLGTEIGLTLAYSPLVSLKETIISDADEPLARQYQQLAKRISAADPEGLDFLLKQASESLKSLDLDQARVVSQTLRDEYSDRADAWLAIADIQQVTGEVPSVEASLRNAINCDQTNVQAFERLQTLLRTQQRHAEVIQLIASILEKADRLTPELQQRLQFLLAELLMREGRFADARTVYSVLIDPTNPQLQIQFNFAEAGRRSFGKIDRNEWLPIVEIFEKTATGVSAMPLRDRMNSMQAMHIAYACVGNKDRATELLNDVERLAASLSPRERIFAVALYDYVPKAEFLSLNRQMKQALLSDGRLWDGMAISHVVQTA